jgi:tRNA-specific 2-thiouridylase
VVGAKRELLRKKFTAGATNWIAVAGLDQPMRVDAKIRHQFHPAPAEIRPLGDGRVEVEFDQPQISITPGQAAVFYDGDSVIGGGWIE